ncbi:MAG: hypothetical protein R2684_13765 [Pyrinomonadaceae bacterium]
MANYGRLGMKANDWQGMSYGDISAALEIGFKLAHFRIFSPYLQEKLDTIIIAATVGACLSVDLSFLNNLDSLLGKYTKVKDAATAKLAPLTCHREFSRYEILGALVATIDTQIASITGVKSGMFVVRDSKSDLFSIPPDVGNTLGIGIGATGGLGVILGFGPDLVSENVEKINKDRMRREMLRRPSDPLVRPAGGFGAG